jgi:hypothetical protein
VTAGCTKTNIHTARGTPRVRTRQAAHKLAWGCAACRSATGDACAGRRSRGLMRWPGLPRPAARQARLLRATAVRCTPQRQTAARAPRQDHVEEGPLGRRPRARHACVPREARNGRRHQVRRRAARADARAAPVYAI